MGPTKEKVSGEVVATVKSGWKGRLVHTAHKERERDRGKERKREKERERESE